MLILLERKERRTDHIRGHMKIIDEHQWRLVCEVDTMEPAHVGLERDSKLAIPQGSYDIDITYSPRFKEDLPLISNDCVPQDRGIRIHAGNRSGDTEGCILVGNYDVATGTLKSSRQAVRKVKEALLRPDESVLKMLIIEAYV